MTLEAGKSSKKHSRSDSAASDSATRPAKKVKETASGEEKAPSTTNDASTSSADTVTLYAWGFEDSPFEDDQQLAAITSDTLAAYLGPRYKTLGKGNSRARDVPALISISFENDGEDYNSDDEDAEDDAEEEGSDDVEEEEKAMKELFGPLLENEYQFAVMCDCEPDFSIMEITLAKEKPKTGPAVQVWLSGGHISELDGFQNSESAENLSLRKQGYKWVTGVRIDKTRKKLRVVQKIVLAHQGEKDTVVDPTDEPGEEGEVTALDADKKAANTTTPVVEAAKDAKTPAIKDTASTSTADTILKAAA